MKSRTALAAVSVIALAACETTLGPPETAAERTATLYGTRVAQTEGSSQGVPCGLDRSPIMARLEPSAGQFVAGFDNQRTEGGLGKDDPFACDRWRSNEYVGSFVFDLSDFTSGVIVDNAILRIERRPTTIPWRLPDSGPPTCDIELRAASEPWTDPYLAGPAGTTFPTVRGPYVVNDRGMTGSDTMTDHMFNVTPIVVHWLTHRRANNGFVLKQTKADGTGVSHENSDSCTSLYTNARLEITFRRTVRRER